MTEELKPCPFCAAVGGDTGQTEVWLFDNTDYESEDFLPMFMVMCNNCLASSGNFQAEEKAVIAWNCLASPWVRMEIECPPIMEPVLLRDRANCCFGWRDPIPAEFITSDNALFSDYVMLATLKRINFEPTHWMPIPPLGEENE